MRKLLIALCACLACAGLWGQTIGFVPMELPESESIDGETAALVQSKLVQMLTRSQAGATAGTAVFGVKPELYVVETRTANTTSGQVSVAKGELTLTALNLVDGSVYHSVSISLTAKLSGTDATAALARAIKPTDSQYARFVRLAREKIADHYATNCATIVLQAQDLFNQGRPEEAAALLEPISAALPCYEQAAALQTAIAKELSRADAQAE